MRRVLLLGPADASSAAAAEGLFGKSILISAIRCLFTYIAVPVLAPIVDLAGGTGPAVGLALGLASAAAIVVSMRRFWAACHRLRWWYTAIGGSILVLVAVQGAVDIAALT